MIYGGRGLHHTALQSCGIPHCSLEAAALFLVLAFVRC